MDHSPHNFLPQAPPLVNQPPQIFGNYNPDGSPVQPHMNGPLFDDAQLAMGPDDNDGQGDPKRRRIARVRRAPRP